MKPLALILAGGLSVRMGRDKATLVIAGETWAERAKNIVAPYVDRTYLAVRGIENADDFSLIDETANIGPAAGFLSAHAKAPRRSWLILAVDFPMATQESIALLIERARISGAAITCYEHADRTPEPLFAVWTAGALAMLKQNVFLGQMGPMATLQQTGYTGVQPRDAAWIRNINTSAEWTLLERELRIPSQVSRAPSLATF